jgi:uncharacterized protein YecT (DUF1311 family)
MADSTSRRILTRTAVLAAALLVTACAGGGGGGDGADTRAGAPMDATAVFSACATGAQVELNQCAAAERSRLETVLADVVAAVAAGHHEQAAVIAETQAQWLNYRDSFCDSYIDRGGSIQPMNAAACDAELTLERIRALCTWDNPNVGMDSEYTLEPCLDVFRG